MNSSVWNLDQAIAKLCLGAFSAEIDTNKPTAGLGKLQVNQEFYDGHLWQIGIGSSKNSNGNAPLPNDSLPTEFEEAFVRGNDLVASYKATGANPFRSTICWITKPSNPETPQRESLSLLVSVETDLLDSYPEVVASSELPIEELLLIEMHTSEEPTIQELANTDEPISFRKNDAEIFLLYRLAGGKLSLVEMIHPDDFRQVDIQRSDSHLARADWHFLGQFLEKGVIRRARMNALVLPRENDIATAISAYRDFAQSEAILTA